MHRSAACVDLPVLARCSRALGFASHLLAMSHAVCRTADAASQTVPLGRGNFPEGLCWKFQRNNCQFGARCYYAHVTLEEWELRGREAAQDAARGRDAAQDAASQTVPPPPVSSTTVSSQTVSSATSSRSPDGRDLLLAESMEEAAHWRKEAAVWKEMWDQLRPWRLRAEATTAVALRQAGLSPQALDDLVAAEVSVLRQEEL